MDIQERIRGLQEQIHRNKSIIDGLANNGSFKMLLEDFQESIRQADDSWHLLNLDDDKQMSTFNQLRAIKLAGSQLVNVLQSYEYNNARAQAEISELGETEGEERTTEQTSYMEDDEEDTTTTQG